MWLMLRPPESVFLVHGHDTSSISDIEAFLSDLGVDVVILSRVRGSEQSLLQRFLKSAKHARFAIAILRPTTWVSRASSMRPMEWESAPYSSVHDRTSSLNSVSFTDYSDGRTCSCFADHQTRCFRTLSALRTSMALFSTLWTVRDGGGIHSLRSSNYQASS